MQVFILFHEIHTLKGLPSIFFSLWQTQIPPNYLCLSGFPVGPLIGRYCGTKIPPEIKSSSGLLSLSFHTDMAVAKDGFSARYNMTHKEVSDSK